MLSAEGSALRLTGAIRTPNTVQHLCWVEGQGSVAWDRWGREVPWW